jgi:hypothetical protein
MVACDFPCVHRRPPVRAAAPGGAGRWWRTRPGPAYARHLADQAADARLQEEVANAVPALRGQMLIPGADIILGSQAG